VAGSVALAMDADDELPEIRRVRLASATDPSLWMQAAVEDDGTFEAVVPAGDYTVSVPERTIGNPYDNLIALAPASTVEVTVPAGGKVDAPALAVAAAPELDFLEDEGVLFDFTPARAQAFDQLVEELMARYQVPGVSLALVKDGVVVHQRAYGVQNAYSGEAVRADTVFEAASITKTIFAFAVNRMAERGEIDLDRPLHEYLPFEDIAYDDRYRAITARHVLSHQTGLPNWRWQNDDGRIDIKFEPGTAYGYSGEGFEYLGRVVAHIADKPLETVLLEETQRPMGLTENTWFSSNDALKAVVSRGHLDGMAGPHDLPGAVGVAFSMYTEAGAFANYMLALMKREGLSAEQYDRMLSPETPLPEDDLNDPEIPESYGLGFHLADTPLGLAWGHGGNNGNFTCQFEIYDEHDLGFVIFTNANTGPKLVDDLREYLVMGRKPGSDGSTAP
ncbi:MAG: serine hydrolase domain-containing protein, partial [Pseudomonadota bacterium]